jgi:flagellar basal-body rod modification protein FlgD
MAVTSISSQTTIKEIIDRTTANAESRDTSGDLGKDDFLNLLVTQLRYQDPLQPTDDKEFIGQMAQFSALEQMQNANASATQSRAFSLIGKHVVATVTDETTHATRTVEGDVASVKVNAGKTYVVVNGESIEVDKVTDVTESTKSSFSTLASFTGLMGYQVEGAVYDSKTGDIVGVNGTVKAVQAGLNENYAVIDDASVEIGAIITDPEKSDTEVTGTDSILEYLAEHDLEQGATDNIVTLVIKNSTTKMSVPVTGQLQEYSQASDGTITAVLDQLMIPIESVAVIKPQE